MLKTARLAALALIVMVPQGALAGPEETLRSWYTMLQSGSDARIGGLLADNAVIVLEDIGVEQSKAEFMDSLGEWKDAIKGGSVDWKLKKKTSDSATATVCYRFTSGPMMVREDFTFSGEQIVKSVQKQLGSDCEKF